MNKAVEGIRDTAKQPDVAFNKALDSVKSMTAEIAEGTKKVTGQLHDAFEAAKKNPNIVHETTAKVQHASEKMLAKTKDICNAAQEKVAGLVQDVKKSMSQEVGVSRGK
jgi:methyl-accepting chemotaxis protein